MKQSILKRTCAMITITFVLLSIIFFIILYSRAYYALKSQALQYVGEKTVTMQTKLNSYFDTLKNDMYRYSSSITKYPDNGNIVNHISNSMIMNSDQGINFLIDRNKVLAISMPVLLSSLNVDNSWYYERASKNRIIITEPHYSNLTAGRSIAVIQYISLPDNELLNITEVRTNTLFRNTTENISNKDTIVVMTNEGDTVYASNTSQLFDRLITVDAMPDLSQNTKKWLTDLPIGTHEIQYENKQLVACKEVYNGMWSLYYILDAADFNTAATKEIQPYFIYMTALVIILVAVCMLLSAGIVKPIRNLKNQIDNLSPDENGVALITTNRSDEIGSLANSFNALMTRLKESSDEKFQLEYKVLQSQIQPHFLFNVHMCIDAELERKEYDNARKMLALLDEILRESTGKIQNYVPISHEIELLYSYVNLQQMRMGDKFCINIENWETYQDIMIPNLLLQPIVENAIYHGFMDLDRRGEIDISFFDENNMLHILIEDNGKGMSEDILAKLLNDELPASPQRGMFSIGLHNVRQRIRNVYGNQGTMHIFSRVGLGTRIEIVIPMCS